MSQIVRITGSRFGSISLLVALFLLLACLLFPSLTEAQTESITVRDANLWLYPEYDDSRLLVMLEGQVVGTSPTTTMSFLVPEDAEIYSAGSIDSAGQYTGGPPDRTASTLDGWDVITYDVTTSIFRVEYYHDVIPAGATKSIVSEFIPLYPVDGLRIYIQQPRTATDFHVEPSLASLESIQETDSYGMTVEVLDYASLEANQSLVLSISYVKTNPYPSLKIIAGLQNVDLWLYPEYDDPRLLVMMVGEVVGVAPPAPIEFLVPEGAQMFSAGSIDADLKYAGGPPERTPSDVTGWDVISYEITTSTFRVEYYLEAIEGDVDKLVTSEFITLLPIDGLLVHVQQPRKSSDFRVMPYVESSMTAEDYENGFRELLYAYTALSASDSLRFDIEYTKSDPLPSLAIEESSFAGWPYVGGGIAGVCLLCGVAAYWVVRKRRMDAELTAQPSPAKRRLPEQRYCTECGAKVAGSFRYCPECGTPLRK